MELWKSFPVLISFYRTFEEISLFVTRLSELIYLCDMFNQIVMNNG